VHQPSEAMSKLCAIKKNGLGTEEPQAIRRVS